MPNPSTLAETEQASIEEYEAALRLVYDTRNSKATREAFLRRARQLADQLGIEQPGPVNGLSAEEAQERSQPVVKGNRFEQMTSDAIQIGSLSPTVHRSTQTTFMPIGEKLFALTKGQRLILIDALTGLQRMVKDPDVELAAERGELIRLFNEK